MDNSSQPVKCSVIIPTRQSAAVLRQTLESLGGQPEKTLK
jgi:hypothetical protein